MQIPWGDCELVGEFERAVVLASACLGITTPVYIGAILEVYGALDLQEVEGISATLSVAMIGASLQVPLLDLFTPTTTNVLVCVDPSIS